MVSRQPSNKDEAEGADWKRLLNLLQELLSEREYVSNTSQCDITSFKICLEQILILSCDQGV